MIHTWIRKWFESSKRNLGADIMNRFYYRVEFATGAWEENFILATNCAHFFTVMAREFGHLPGLKTISLVRITEA